MKLPALGLLLASCAATADPCPIPGAVPADDLILPGEDHFAHLWQVTFGGENAEAYWSFDGERLCMQVRNEERGWNCDRICVTEADGSIDQLSNDQPMRRQRLGSGTALLQRINGRWHGAADPRREGTALATD